MKRATLLLENELYQRVKALAREKGATMKEIVNTLVREGLNHIGGARPKRSFELPLHKGLGPRPGVDISDREALYDLMDEPKRK